VYGDPDEASHPGVDSARAAKPDQALVVAGMSSCALAGAPKKMMRNARAARRPAHLNRTIGEDDMQKKAYASPGSKQSAVSFEQVTSARNLGRAANGAQRGSQSRSAAPTRARIR
jgi:hypothetical protein